MQLYKHDAWDIRQGRATGFNTFYKLKTQLSVTNTIILLLCPLMLHPVLLGQKRNGAQKADGTRQNGITIFYSLHNGTSVYNLCISNQ